MEVRQYVGLESIVKPGAVSVYLIPNLVARKISLRFSGFSANHFPMMSSESPYLSAFGYQGLNWIHEIGRNTNRCPKTTVLFYKPHPRSVVVLLLARSIHIGHSNPSGPVPSVEPMVHFGRGVVQAKF